MKRLDDSGLCTHHRKHYHQPKTSLQGHFGDHASESNIGRTALYQARAGGNHAMIVTAERYIVTNAELTHRRRPVLLAPWEREETYRFLSNKNNDWGVVGSREEEGINKTPAWKVVWETERNRKRTEELQERLQDRRLEELLARQALDDEIERAARINCQREKLNTELLEVARRAGELIPSVYEPSSYIEQEVKGEYENDELETKRRETLQAIANGLSVG